MTSGASLPTDAGIALLSIFCSFLGKSWADRKLSEQYPLGSFAYGIQKALHGNTPSQAPSFFIKQT